MRNRYTTFHDMGWDVLDHGSVIVTFWENLPDAQERAEALAAELNEANKPRYSVRDDGKAAWVTDTREIWVMAKFALYCYNDNVRLAQELAERLNSGEFLNE